MSFIFHDSRISWDTLEPDPTAPPPQPPGSAWRNDCDDTRDAPLPEPPDWRRWLVVNDCDDREGT